MYRYANIDNRGVITNISLYNTEVKDTTECVHITDSPWLKIGDYIDSPNPVNANTIIDTRINILDRMFINIEKEQFRALCSIVKALLTDTEINSKDREWFLDYERQKEDLRKVYPIDADGDNLTWLRSSK